MCMQRRRCFGWPLMWLCAVIFAQPLGADGQTNSVWDPRVDSALRSVRRLPSGEISIHLAPTPDRRYVLEASPDLRQWSTLTNFLGDGLDVDWLDAEAAQFARRFYRAPLRGVGKVIRLAEGSFAFTLGVEPGVEYFMETSTNLVDWTPWERFISLSPLLRVTNCPTPPADQMFFRVQPTNERRLLVQADGAWALTPGPAYGVVQTLESSTDFRVWAPLWHLIGNGESSRLPGPLSLQPQTVLRIRTNAVADVFDSFVILGQSNASGSGELADPEPPNPAVWMLGNDYKFKVAVEPLDDSVGQVDQISADPGVWSGGAVGHSWGLRAAKGVAAVLPKSLVVVPCSRGNSLLRDWLPAADRLDRGTLFGSANYRQRQAMPGGPRGLWIYGHESNCNPLRIATYLDDWEQVLTEVRRDFGEPPVIYAQMASSTAPVTCEALHQGADLQCTQETGAGGPRELPRHFMVVTFDLPLIDFIHLNRAGENVLGDRFALATREHIYGERVNGTGPRLVSLTHPYGDRKQIRVKFTRPINESVNRYDQQFTVFDQGVPAPLISVQRDSDVTAVLLILSQTPQGEVTVSYGGQPRSAPGVSLPNVVKDGDGLPAPQFRRRRVP